MLVMIFCLLARWKTEAIIHLLINMGGGGGNLTAQGEWLDFSVWKQQYGKETSSYIKQVLDN